MVVSAAFPIAADIEPVSVELSLQQTFALFGSEFYGTGYTSSDGVARVPFRYLCTASELRTLDHLTFWNYYSDGGSLAATDSLISAFNGQDFLVYACDATLINNDSSHLFTVYAPFSINMQNVQFYRQRFYFSTQADNSRAIYASTLTTHRSNIQLTSTNSTAAYSQYTETFGSLREPNNSTTLSGFPLAWTNLNRSGGHMLGQLIDLYYHPTGDGGAAINFDVNGVDFYMKNVKRYRVPSTIADWFGVEYEGENPVANALLNKDVFFLFIAPPVISDGYILPDDGGGSGASPDYTEQIDNLVTGQGHISAQLAAILAKLDAIYQRMQSMGLTLNPSRNGAQNIPSSLDSYMQSGSFSSGAVDRDGLQGAISGASFVPVGSVISAAGLSGMFGLLVALSCAGWVLTRGRKG